MGKLEIKKLELEIDNKKILKDISVEINSGEALVVIGESGAGKTVFSKLFLGFFPQNSKIKGEILLNSENILKYDSKKWEKIRGQKIAYVSQNPMAVFNEYQTIKSHIVELFEDKVKMDKKDYLKLFLENIKKLGFEKVENILEKYPFQFSGGQLQRIMFSMILQLNPEVLIVDEPTSALDYKNTKIILNLLKEFQRDNKVLIVITHDYKLAYEIGGKTIIIKKGEIVEKGITEEILLSPKTEYGKELIEVSKKLRYKSDENV